jgi:hypothetical protein
MFSHLPVRACCHQLALIWVVHHAEEEGVGKQTLHQQQHPQQTEAAIVALLTVLDVPRLL